MSDTIHSRYVFNPTAEQPPGGNFENAFWETLNRFEDKFGERGIPFSLEHCYAHISYELADSTEFPGLKEYRFTYAPPSTKES
jgi:hypothetical protein